MNTGEKWIQGKKILNFDLDNFWSESSSIRTSEGRAPASELALQRGSLLSEIALQGETFESKIVYRKVGPDFEIGIENMKTYQFRKTKKNIFGS